jgi:hypothetical protein
MGLAPADASIGDQVVRFWGCDVAAILRDDTIFTSKSLQTAGRADGRGPHIVGRAYALGGNGTATKVSGTKQCLFLRRSSRN